MRDLKFRAWNKNLIIPGSNEFMEYSDEKNGSLSRFFLHYPYSGTFMNGGAERTIMQFTGLTDKNGKGIYESDLIKQPYRNSGKPITVVFAYGCFQGKYGTDGINGLSYILGAEEDGIEIIGNIYESPDLLK